MFKTIDDDKGIKMWVLQLKQDTNAAILNQWAGQELLHVFFNNQKLALSYKRLRATRLMQVYIGGLVRSGCSARVLS